MGRKSSLSEEQTIRALKELDAGAKTSDVCRLRFPCVSASTAPRQILE